MIGRGRGEEIEEEEKGKERKIDWEEENRMIGRGMRRRTEDRSGGERKIGKRRRKRR